MDKIFKMRKKTGIPPHIEDWKLACQIIAREIIAQFSEGYLILKVFLDTLNKQARRIEGTSYFKIRNYLQLHIMKELLIYKINAEQRLNQTKKEVRKRNEPRME